MKNRKNPILFRRAGRGSIAMIAMLLLTSAVLRLASGAGVAIAESAADDAAKPQNEAHVSAQETEHSTLRKTATRSEMNKLLIALREREARLNEREVQIQIRTKALLVVDEEIEKRLQSLEKAEARLRSTLALADGAAEDDLARLTSVYENMKPKDAAALFEMMEPDFAAGFLGRMRPDAAAAVMAGLTPDAAYSISVILASRNANVPKT